MDNNKKGVLAALGLIAALGLVKASEGLQLATYRDTGEVKTVCYGHTGADVKLGQVRTEAQCENFLVDDLVKANASVNSCVHVPLNNNQRSAFVSFTYNVGSGNFCKSNLVKRVNAGDYQGACDQLLRWVYVAGKDCRLKSANCAGIVKRRVVERELCLRSVA